VHRTVKNVIRWLHSHCSQNLASNVGLPLCSPVLPSTGGRQSRLLLAALVVHYRQWMAALSAAIAEVVGSPRDVCWLYYGLEIACWGLFREVRLCNGGVSIAMASMCAVE